MGTVQQQPSLFGSQSGLARKLQHRHSPAAAFGIWQARLQEKQHILVVQCDVHMMDHQWCHPNVYHDHVRCRLLRSSSWTQRRRLPGSGPRGSAWSLVLALSMSASRSHCPWRTRWAHSSLSGQHAISRVQTYSAM